LFDVVLSEEEIKPMETLDRIAAPAFRQIEKIEIVQAKASKLDNGIPVYTVNAGQQDLVKVEFIFPNRYDIPSEVLTASAANRMLAEGTKQRNAQQLADSIDYYGAFYETEESLDFNSVNLYTLNKYLGQTLPVLKEILTEPSFPENELAVFKQNTRQRLQVNMEKVSYLSRTHFHEMLFGKQHPYGFRTSLADVDAITAETLKNYYATRYNLSDCLIFVSGKVDDETLRLLNATFGRIPASVSQKGQKEPVLPEPFLEKNNFISKPDAIQSALRIGKLMFNKTHPDYHGMLVLNTVLGGYFGSRLMANLREDKGYTYGIGSSMVSMKQAGYLVISTEVAREVSGKAVDEIFHEIGELKTRPVEEDELQEVKNYLAGSLMRGMDGAFNLSDRAKGLILYGLDYSYFERYFRTIRDVTAGELMEMANKYFDKSSFYQLEVGDK
jgi:predicted Zn-dependent peptidase